jgi:large subunit ribosomal protein L9
MKVLLLEDMDNLGEAGDVITVADGYARNYLIPRSLAKPATEGAVQEAEQIRKSTERKRARERADAQAFAKRFGSVTLRFQARAGETGKLYGSITPGDLAEGLEQELGQAIDRRKIMADPLRQVGEHEVQVRLMSDVTATFRVIIEAEGGEAESAQAAGTAEEPAQ